jgi:hypothetical protein
MIHNNEINNKRKCRTPNERFYESGGVCPQTVLCEFSSASPARTFVSPRLHKAAWTLAASREKVADSGFTNLKNFYLQLSAT